MREPREANADVAIPELINGGASVIVMADIGNLATDAEDAVEKWVQNGGTLVRFAGPRLAAATDKLIPVNLRHGDRVLGGSLSWQTPQPLASFSDKSPFAGLAIPDDVVVRRQVLAEPDGALGDRTWAALADGTPLVTAAKSGKGWLVLFHVTADTSWSNLPLSGTFVDMLRRIIAFSANAGSRADAASAPLPAYRLLDGAGHFAAPTADAEPLTGDIAKVAVNLQHPPGLYGSEDGFRALNLLDDNATLVPFAIPTSDRTTVRSYPTAAPTILSPWLIALAAGLLGLDALAVLWLNGGFRWRPRRAATTTAAVMLAALALFAAATAPARTKPATPSPCRRWTRRTSPMSSPAMPRSTRRARLASSASPTNLPRAPRWSPATRSASTRRRTNWRSSP